MSKYILDWFNWITENEISQNLNNQLDLYWLDIFTDSGICQINKRITSETLWYNYNVSCFELFDNIIIASGNWELDKRIAWSWASMYNPTNSWDCNNIKVYMEYLIFPLDNTVWRSNTTSISWWFIEAPIWASWGNFLNWSGDHIMKVLNRKLYISDWNVIAELDWTITWWPSNWIFNNNKIKIDDENETILCLEVIWNQLAIWTDKWNLYIWDWESENASSITKTDLDWITALINMQNQLFIFAWKSGVVYAYNGSDFIPVIAIPNFNQSENSFCKNNAVINYKQGILFWIWWNGLYQFNKNKGVFKLSKWGCADWYDLNYWIWALYLESWYKQEFYISRQRGSFSWNYRIEKLDYDNYYAMNEKGVGDDELAPRLLTPFINFNKDWKKIKISWVKLLFRRSITWAGTEANRVKVEYRLNRDDDFTELWTIGAWGVDIDLILRWIDKLCYQIQLRLKFWSDLIANWHNTKLIWLKIY